MRLDIHYVRKSPVAEPTKDDMVAFVNKQLGMGLKPNEITKLIKETFFTQSIGEIEQTVTTITHDTDDPETGAKDTTVLTQAVL